MHLQFAYYESALVVEYLVNHFGQDKLVAILRELGQGTEINQAIEMHTLPMTELETGFEQYAHQTARNMAPGLDWEKPDLATLRAGDREATGIRSFIPPLPRSMGGPGSRQAWEDWAESHPTNFWVMSRRADELIAEEKWAEAKPALEEIIRQYPDFIGSDSAYRLLARAHRELGETNAEREVLAEFAAKDPEATDAYLRLMELVTAEEDWPSVIRNARRYLAVNPLAASPYRFLAKASEATGEWSPAIRACRALLELEPANPADVQFRLAKLLHRTGDPAARRHLLQSLEDAPRHREALALLLEMNDESELKSVPPSTATPASAFE